MAATDTDGRMDRLIAKVAPGWYLKRMIARQDAARVQAYAGTGTGYDGGRTTRRRPNPARTTAPEDIATSGTYNNLIGAGMDLYRNDPLTKSIVNTVATYMGESRPIATSSDPEWNKEATDYFNDFWWNIADARRRPGVDFGTLQKLWTKYSWYGGDMLFGLFSQTAGDVGTLMPYEGLQLRTPFAFQRDGLIINGVRLEKKAPNRITHYYICPPTKAFRTDEKFNRIPQRSAIFAPAPYWRPSMLRGVPELHAVIDALQDFRKTNDNIAGKIVLDSSVWTVEKKGAVGKTPKSSVFEADAAKGETLEWSGTDYGMRLKVNGNPKEDFVTQMPNNPGNNHIAYMEYAAKIISAGVGMPYEMVMHIFTQGSYTANRAARVDFKTMIEDRHAHREKVLNQKVWNWVIGQAMKHGRIRLAPIDQKTGLSEWHKAKWTQPTFPQIDEGKEIKADRDQWGALQTSIDDWARERGQTREQLMNSHDEDVEEMKRRATAKGLTLHEYAPGLFPKSDGIAQVLDTDPDTGVSQTREGLEQWLM